MLLSLVIAQYVIFVATKTPSKAGTTLPSTPARVHVTSDENGTARRHKGDTKPNRPARNGRKMNTKLANLMALSV